MSLNKGKLTILSLLVSSILLTAPVYAVEQAVNPVAVTDNKILASKTFPETLQALIEAPGKKDTITIPMPTQYYEAEFKNVLNGKWSQKKEVIENIFANSSVVQQGDLSLVTLNTNIKESSIAVTDSNNQFYYIYTMANGYVLSAKITTYLDHDDKNRSDKLDFLTDAFATYLLDKGFKKDTSFFDFIPNPISDQTVYRLGNSIVIVKTLNDAFSKNFEVVIQNKFIEDNKEEIMKSINTSNMKHEFNSLELILK